MPELIRAWLTQLWSRNGIWHVIMWAEPPPEWASRVQRCLNKLEVRTERHWRGGQRTYWGGAGLTGPWYCSWRLHALKGCLCLIEVICFLLDYTWCSMPGWGPHSIQQIWLGKRRMIWGGILGQRSLAASKIRISAPIGLVWVSCLYLISISYSNTLCLWRKP